MFELGSFIVYFTVYGIKRLLKKIDVVVKWDYTPAMAGWSCVEVVSWWKLKEVFLYWSLASNLFKKLQKNIAIEAACSSNEGMHCHNQLLSCITIVYYWMFLFTLYNSVLVSGSFSNYGLLSLLRLMYDSKKSKRSN